MPIRDGEGRSDGHAGCEAGLGLPFEPKILNQKMLHSAIHTLTFAYPPISNQEGEWLKDDPGVREVLSASKLYMIAQRKEVTFEDYRFDCGEGNFHFSLRCGQDCLSGISIKLGVWIAEPFEHELAIEWGPKILRVWNQGELLRWLTPDYLFMLYSRHHLEVDGLDEFRRFTELELYYVGISKTQDSLTRLFIHAHENRCRILSNERQMTDTARLTDELMIFMFNVEAIQIVSYGDQEIPDSHLLGPPDLPPENVAADAEKAFVKIMQTNYNTVKFNNYPQGVDGLAQFELDQFAFVINECYSFRTEKATIHGSQVFDHRRDRDPDFIFVKGGDVTLCRADAKP